jgi:hypothetical protein
MSAEEWFMDEDGDLFGTPFATDSLQQLHLQKMYFSDGSMGDALFEGSMGDDFGITLETDDLKPVYNTTIPAYKKKITFAEKIATPMVYQASGEASLVTLDVFGDGAGATQGNDASLTSLGDFVDDDESFTSAVDSVAEEEKKIRRQLMYAVGGVGFFALFGFAMQNLLKVFNKAANNDDVDAGVDVTNATDQLSNANDVASALTGDGGSSYSTAASAAQGTGDIANMSLNASANASHSQVGVGFSLGGQPGGGAALSGPQ